MSCPEFRPDPLPEHHNHLGQALGWPLPHWQAPPRPAAAVLEGRYCRLEALAAERHAAQLFAANSLDRDGRSWTYLPYGPFPTFADYRSWVENAARSADPLFYAIIDRADGKAVGVASYLRIDPAQGSIEVGHLHFSPRLQGSTAATEAMFLLMDHAFGLGYRRYEWKCDALNAASCAAALRLGFQREGLFRQAAVYKQRNRDTAWFAILDRDWPTLRAAFQRWLDADNFDGEGRQKSRLQVTER